MRSCDPLADVMVPPPDQFPCSPANGPAPWAAPVSIPGGANRPTATAKAATLSETTGTKRTNSRRRIAPSGGRALSVPQVDFVIEVRFPRDEGSGLRTRRRAPIRSTDEDAASRTMDIRKDCRQYYNHTGAASATVHSDSANLRLQR